MEKLEIRIVIEATKEDINEIKGNIVKVASDALVAFDTRSLTEGNKELKVI